jgi:hypothetical protein
MTTAGRRKPQTIGTPADADSTNATEPGTPSAPARARASSAHGAGAARRRSLPAARMPTPRYIPMPTAPASQIVITAVEGAMRLNGAVSGGRAAAGAEGLVLSAGGSTV